ncbi:bifunctional 4-hydroxy-2-oxoglutarate aldolase/2-dehydro-3-deoxy-phosphogluconate aldolase [Rhizohabitans arisaemae]|uniref:bifunctional 4-hydroxy-2-oxoglutarate aldolase/2-dehydro-3-deoxy-phosphogluconate aldolase n=1 Tax=Rhizohabitans arisaemae TaxID=2720610 RepID=UPI0024B0BB20|nr:bifunctional 4-hydroxy-2-oxoglutarate aldolase/2-dehydro-3-deoxy-phosphogluconate aldolase [Rhizohabitans arisaemae]
MSLLDLAPVIPVVVIEEVTDAVPLAKALSDGGLPVIEVTLRTEAALPAIAAIRAELPDVMIGAGTIRNPADVATAMAAGARFLVSPGSTHILLDAMSASGLPFLPGAATASEAMVLAEHGVTELKFFPAEAAGGIKYLKSLAGPLPDIRFCPTGGIRPETAPDYLALPNVGCVGGTWLTPSTSDYDRVTELAREAAALRGR